MSTDTQRPKKSVSLNIFYWVMKLRAGFVALILVLASAFIYQYWQDLSQNPLNLVAKLEIESVAITLNAPEKISSNEDGLNSEIVLVTSPMGGEILNTDSVIIDFSSDNANVNFEPKQIVLSKLELEKEDNQFSIKVTSKTNLQGKIIYFTSTIINPDDSKVSFSQPIPIENSTKNPIVFFSAFLSFLTAILSFIVQIRNFFSK